MSSRGSGAKAHSAYDIAIVGAEAVYPGAADFEAFERLLFERRSSVRDVPEGRWIAPAARLMSERRDAPDRVISRRMALIDPADFAFDPHGWPWPAEFVAALDPTFQLALHVGRKLWSAVDFSGFDRRRCGVSLASIALPTDGSSALTRAVLCSDPRTAAHGPITVNQAAAWNAHPVGAPAGLLRAGPGLEGGAITFDAACASSLYALKYACDELTAGRADAMIAGGVSRPEALYTQMGFGLLQALSPSGVCRPFRVGADGLVVGEGCGLVLLMRREDALAAGLPVLAVIRAVGVSNDMAGSLISPDSEGQLRAMRMAYEQAGWRAGEVDFIECHGTGTPQGDAVEFASLATLLRESGARRDTPLPIGAVKSNIGHLLTAAGIAGLHKLMICLRRGEFCGDARDNESETAERSIADHDAPIDLLASNSAWQRNPDKSLRRAALSSFGFGGINAHLLLEEPIAAQARVVGPSMRGASRDAGEPIAIVGVGARFGELQTFDAFARDYLRGESALRSRPPNRWLGLDELLPEELQSRFACGAWIERLSIPVGKYRLPPREIEQSLAQQMLMLEVLHEALHDARVDTTQRDPRRGAAIGIGLDVNTSNYHHRWVRRLIAEHTAARSHCDNPSIADIEAAANAASPALNAPRVLGSLGGIVASRVAREFGCGGASYTVSALESSGLRAIELATRALQRGEIDLALAGAVDLCGDVRAAMAIAALLPHVDAIGEGAAAVVLKRLSDAERDGDYVYAVIEKIGSLANSAMDGGGADELVGRSDASEIIGYSGCCAGIADLLCAIASLDSRVLPESADRPRRYWLRDRAAGPRRIEQRTMNLDGSECSIVLRERMGDEKPARLASAPVVRSLPQATARYSADQVAFVYPGSGNQYAGMGAGLSAAWPGIVAEHEAISPRLAAQWRAGALWRSGERVTRALDDPLTVILGQVSFGILATDILRVSGIAPRFALGYSLGETAALLALRVWRDWGTMLDRLEQSPLFTHDLAGECRAVRRAWSIDESAPIDWSTAVLPRDADAARIEIGESDRVRVLIANASGECVVGGLRAEVERLASRLGAQPLWVRGTSTVHCDAVEVVAGAYRELHDLPTTPSEDVRFYSAARAAAYVPTRASARDSITAQAIRGFDFAKQVEAAYGDGARVFVEVGPGASCTRMIRRILGDRPHLAISVSSGAASARDEESAMLDAIATLQSVGVASAAATSARQESMSLPNADGFAAAKRVDVPLGPPMRAFERPLERELSRAPAQPQIAEAAALAAWSAEVASMTARSAAITAQAHQRFLSVATSAFAQATAAVTHQAAMFAETRASSIAPQGSLPYGRGSEHAGRGSDPMGRDERDHAVAFDRDACMEFAIGKIGNVLGPAFAQIDQYPVRVRLPDEPLMLVDRIVSISGEPRSLTRGMIVTEHDVLPGAWYLDHGRVPVCIAVESGQADLFLCSYLGIDHVVRGTRAYRLLDATISFQRGLPQAGETLHYKIEIEKFVRQGDSWLFFFRFDGFANGAPLLTMRSGCAGFFTEEEIANSGGIVGADDSANLGSQLGELERRSRAAAHPCAELVPLERCALDEARVAALRAGDLSAAFGAPFDRLAIRDASTIPDGRMRLLHRVVDCDPLGGEHGLGRVVAEADIHPDDWFLTCHFVDDMVMPGTLMYECCAHTLRVLLMRMGWVAEADAVAYEPLPETPAKLRCRGPVTAKTRVVTYEVTIKRMGYGPEPFVIADALMRADGKPIVTFTDMSLRLTGQTRETIRETWREVGQAAVFRALPLVSDEIAPSPAREEAGRGIPQPALPKGAELIGNETVDPMPRTGVFDKQTILAYSNGPPSAAFGEPYAIFDAERKLARLPGPPYQVMDRVTRIAGYRAFELKSAGNRAGWIEAQYDTPADAWYFAANRQSSMPFAVLLEIALQPCGWLAAYLGSALRSSVDLSFRNLGGTATQHIEVFPGAGTLTTRVRMTDCSEAAGMIIQKFDYQVWSRAGLVYSGDTSFGFFTREALANQVGLRDAAKTIKQWRAGAAALEGQHEFEPDMPVTPEDAEMLSDFADRGFDRLVMPATAWRMIDAVVVDQAGGGPDGLGYLQATKRVRPEEWFFAAHFYQDPVCPGSLGLESLLQLLKHAAIGRLDEKTRASHRFGARLHKPHTWLYRGQVVPKNREVTVEAAIRTFRGPGGGPDGAIGGAGEIVANGFLSVDGLTIYEMRDFGLSIVPREE